MATLESMAIRSNAACDRIEHYLTRLGVVSDPLPRIHREREMLRCIQLEAIADALSQVEGIGVNADRPRAELLKLAIQRGLTPQGTGKDGYVTKTDLLRALETG